MLDDYGALIRSGQAIVPDFAAEAARRQMMTMQRQELGMRLAAAQREQDEADAFDADLDSVLANPNAAAYSQLILRHPKQAEKVKAAWNLLEASRQQTDLTQMGEIYAAAANGRYDLAAANLKRRIDSQKANDAEPDADDQAILQMLESGDPEQQRAALGMTGLLLAAVTGPDKFAATYGNLTDAEEDFTLSPGSIRYGSDGRVIASAPFAPRALSVSPGETVIEYQPGGGGPTSGGGGASAPRRSMGWTPRARDGGDNSDRVVDNKLGVIGRRTGFDPDAELSPESLPKLFDAIAATENTASALNNPGGIKDGKWAQSQPGYAGSRSGLAMFDSPGAGRNAGLALLGQFYNRGQRTVRDIIEGAPTAGSSNAGGPKVIAQGGPKPVKPSETRVLNGKTYYKIDGRWFDNAEGV